MPGCECSTAFTFGGGVWWDSHRESRLSTSPLVREEPTMENELGGLPMLPAPRLPTPIHHDFRQGSPQLGRGRQHSVSAASPRSGRDTRYGRCTMTGRPAPSAKPVRCSTTSPPTEELRPCRHLQQRRRADTARCRWRTAWARGARSNFGDARTSLGSRAVRRPDGCPESLGTSDRAVTVRGTPGETE
jgi:hypothetical protein